MDIKNMHWGWIIFILIVFFPIGLVLGFIKLLPGNSILRTLIIMITLSIGLFFNVFGLLFLITADFNFDYWVSVFFLIIGTPLLILSWRLDKTSHKIKMYNELIINQSFTNIENIALQVDSPKDVVVKDLQWLISIGKLERYNIDLNNKLIFKNGSQPSPTIKAENNLEQKITRNVAISCKGCGATISAEVGKVTLCDFCDTPNNA